MAGKLRQNWQEKGTRCTQPGNDNFPELNANTARPVGAVGARSGVLGGEVVCVEGAVPLEAPPESVDVVRVPEAGHEVRLRALQEADLIWKWSGEE